MIMATENNISVKTIVDTYLKSKGLKRMGGNDGDASPILPLIMMDMAYQLYREHIAPIECKQEMKQLKNRWKMNYSAFNKDFFRVFNADETDFIVDMMDEFDEFIKKDLTIAFWQFTNVMKDEPIDRQKVLSACMLINILCQCANIVWERVYKSSKSQSSTNQNLLQCEHIIHRWKNLYYGKNKPTIDCNKSEQICLAVDILCKHQIEFMKRYHVKTE